MKISRKAWHFLPDGRIVSGGTFLPANLPLSLSLVVKLARTGTRSFLRLCWTGMNIVDPLRILKQVNPMLSRRRWVVGLGIVIAGCCAAIPFQRQASMDPGPSERLTLSSPQLQLWLAATESNPTSPPSQGIEDHHRIESLRLRVPSPVTAPRSPVQQVPSIDDRYPVVTGEADQETQHVSSSRSQRQEAASDRYHRIQNGDTLRKLAEQYLGNAELAASIYDANRSILASPDLLPLGRQLRIPGPR